MAVKDIIIYGYILIACMCLFASASYIPKTDEYVNAIIPPSLNRNIVVNEKNGLTAHRTFQNIMFPMFGQSDERRKTVEKKLESKSFDLLRSKTAILSLKSLYWKDKIMPFVDHSKKQTEQVVHHPVDRVRSDLSYARFDFLKMNLSYQNVPKSNLTVTLTIANVGDADGNDVIECYVYWDNSSLPVPRKQLVFFDSVNVNANSYMAYAFTLTWMSWAYWNNGTWSVETANMTLCCGDEPSTFQATQDILCADFPVYGDSNDD